VRVAFRDPDELLIAAMTAPPPLADARGSLEFWRRRRAALPFYRLRARREANEMTRRWRLRVAAAERVRYGTGPIGLLRRLLAGDRPSWLVPSATALAWRFVSRRLVLGAIVFAAAWLLAGALTVAALVALLA